MKRKLIIAASVALLAITASYSNHFLSGLHFGDYTIVRDNSAIRSLLNIPRFFVDTATSATNPADYAYRPAVTSSLAIDFFLGKSAPFFYHFPTFLVYLAGLAVIGWLFSLIFEQTAPHPWNSYLAIMGAALFGLHPAVTELMNQVSQRGELFAALGVVGGVALYAGLPMYRRFCYYLIPPLIGVLANPAGLIFGPMLLAYILLVEAPPTYENETFTPDQTRSRDQTQADIEPSAPGSGRKRIRIRRRKHPFRRYVKAQLTRFMPALLFTGATVGLHSLVTPFRVTGEAATSYWFTQPWVGWHYFSAFFAPFHLSPASDQIIFNSYDIHAVIGLGFLLGLVSVALLLAVSPPWRPAVFGIWWFIIGLLPGAILVQPDVESSTRMFLPFIGLALSVTWAARMILPRGEPLRRLEAIVASALLLSLAVGTYTRNRVWSDDETLWRDDVEKNPKSVRGLENYALVLTSKGQARKAYDYLWRARLLRPDSAEVEANMGAAAAALNQTDLAEEHFRRAMSLGADQPIIHFLYAVWLEHQGRAADAIDAYSWASSLAPSDLRPRYGLMRLYSAGGDWNNLRKTVEDVQEIAPRDPGTVPFATIARNHPDSVKDAEQLVKENPSAENYLTLSKDYWLAGEFTKCLDTAQKAAQLRPGYAEAYNTAGVAYISLGRLDEAIASVKKALEYDPDNKLARANLAEWQNYELVVGNAIMRK